MSQTALIVKVGDRLVGRTSWGDVAMIGRVVEVIPGFITFVCKRESPCRVCTPAKPRHYRLGQLSTPQHRHVIRESMIRDSMPGFKVEPN